VWMFFFSSRRRHTRFSRDWSSDVCSSDLPGDEALQEHAAIIKEALALAAHGFKGFAQFAVAVAAGQADAATAGGAFQHYRVAQRSEERRVGKECRAKRSRKSRR